MNALKRYELMVIVSPRLTESEVASLHEEIKSQLGEIVHEDIWGKRKFAYPIEKYADGFYAVWNFHLPQDQVASLHDFLRIHQGVLRHLIILVPENYQPITGKKVEEGLDAYYEVLKQGKRGKMRGERPVNQKPSVTVQGKERASLDRLGTSGERKEIEKPVVKKVEEPVAVKSEKIEEFTIEKPVKEEVPVVAEPEEKEEPVVVAKPKKVPEKKAEEPEEEVLPAPKPEKKPESHVDSKLDEKLKSIFEDELSF